MFRLCKLPRLSKNLLRSYHSQDHTISNAIIDNTRIENKILSQSLQYIPQYGFSEKCVNEAITQLQYPDSIQSVLATSFNGNSIELQLMIHWLKTQRQNLEAHVNDAQSQLHSITNEYDRVSYLINKRLLYNEPIIGQLSGGIAQLMVPYNLPVALEELHNLGDDISFHAGDQSNDFAWYTKRMSVSSVYVASEMYMLQDKSEGYRNTKEFVEDKVRNIDHLGQGYDSVEQWMVFNAIGVFNLIKSQIARG